MRGRGRLGFPTVLCFCANIHPEIQTLAREIKMTIPLRGISTGERFISYETNGFQGESCRDATKAFEQAVGATVDEELKSEFYETEQRQEFLTDGD